MVRKNTEVSLIFSTVHSHYKASEDKENGIKKTLIPKNMALTPYEGVYLPSTESQHAIRKW